MPALPCLYYQQDDAIYYLHLDGGLRQIPDTQTLHNLYGTSVNSSIANPFANKTSAPFGISNPLLSGARLYTLANSLGKIYLADVFPWNLQETVFREVVNITQLQQLGFTQPATPWTATSSLSSVGVPLAIHTGQNWHLQTFFSGYHIVYNHLCHPENPINPYFKTWLDNNFTKDEVKTRIIDTQHQIDELKGLVAVQTPSFNPIGGVQYYQTISVTINCATPNANIYYTTNGDAPLPKVSNLYTGPVTLNISANPLELKAIAEYPDSIGTSAVESELYFYTEFPIAEPTFSPNGGPQSNSLVEVNISCPTQGVSIFYSTTGDATRSSTPYTRPVTLDLSQHNIRLSAFAIHNTYPGSGCLNNKNFSYSPPQVETPAFSLAAGSYAAPDINVAIHCNTPNAKIYYTTDGSTPTISSTLYITPINLNINSTSTTLNAIATVENAPNSNMASATYTGITGKSWNHVWRLHDNADDMISNVNLTSTGVIYETGQNGNAATLNGSAYLNGTSAIDMKSAFFTVAIWAKASSMPASHAAIWTFETNSNGTNGPGLFLYNDGRIKGQTRVSTGNQYVTCWAPSGTVIANTWNHYVVVSGTDKKLRFYINGVQNGDSVVTDGTIDSNACSKLWIGSESGPSFGFTGSIERLYYMNQALTAAEVLQLYNMR